MVSQAVASVDGWLDRAEEVLQPNRSTESRRPRSPGTMSVRSG
jgi:hypothetical protein